MSDTKTLVGYLRKIAEHPIMWSPAHETICEAADALEKAEVERLSSTVMETIRVLNVKVSQEAARAEQAERQRNTLADALKFYAAGDRATWDDRGWRARAALKDAGVE